MTELDLDRYCKQLNAMQLAIDNFSKERDSSSEVVELDQTRTGRVSRMDAMQQQAMAVANRERAKQEKQRIITALTRISDGTFGECLSCGGDIAIARLDANPAVTLCISCAEKREQ